MPHNYSPSCSCSSCDIRVEICDLKTGLVQDVVRPVALNWQEKLNRPGHGAIALATRDLSVRNVWPHLNSAYITVSGFPVGGFFFEEVDAQIGATNVAMKEIDEYLHYRVLDKDLSLTNTQQTVIGSSLVKVPRHMPGDTIPLYGDSEESRIPRDRNYKGYDLPVLGELINNLTDVINGPDYEKVHTKKNGAWSTTMVFRDYVGRGLNLQLVSDVNVSDYSLNITSGDHATVVIAVGAGEEKDMLLASATELRSIYPRFDATPSWKDVSKQTTLQEHASGYLEENRDPVVTPIVTIPGCDDIPADGIRLGDSLTVHIDYGTITFHGRARVTDISWKLEEGSPLQRELGLIPLVRSSESVLNQDITQTGCPDCRRYR